MGKVGGVGESIPQQPPAPKKPADNLGNQFPVQEEAGPGFNPHGEDDDLPF